MPPPGRTQGPPLHIPSDMNLQNQTIWVVRPEAQAAHLCEQIETHGGTPVSLPVIEIVPLEARPTQPDAADRWLFCSRNAVICGVPNMFPQLARNDTPRCFALGAGTAAELRRHGLPVAGHGGADASSEEMLELPEWQATQVRGMRITLVKGRNGRALLREELTQRGAQVSTLDVYQRIMPDIPASRFHALWQDTRPDIVAVGSEESLRNLMRLCPEDLRGHLWHCGLAVLGQRAERRAGLLGWKGAVRRAQETSDAGLLEAIRELSDQEPPQG